MPIIEFTDKDLDYVANVLAQRPWSEVNTLLEDMRKQIQRQSRLGNGVAVPTPTKTPPEPPPDQPTH